MMIFKSGTFGKQLSLGDIMRMGSREGIRRRGREMRALSLSLSYEDIVRRWPAASQEEGSHQELNLPTSYLGLPAARTVTSKFAV